jgi:hypothetical protein
MVDLGGHARARRRVHGVRLNRLLAASPLEGSSFPSNLRASSSIESKYRYVANAVLEAGSSALRRTEDERTLGTESSSPIILSYSASITR